ncbi:MAG: nitrite/sulfite reductase [Acidobacteria bacterium]|nr:nitrite/sulfite reductase [Acidobacteriota bacterium]
MAAVDDLRTLGRSRLSFASEAEIDEFVTMLHRFERGELTAEAWRAFRLLHGTYAQRQPGDVHMLRVKIPQGILSAAELEALADVGDLHSRGFGHITTRQNIQFHFVELRDVEHAMRRLGEAGLTTREACGNAVRNITACPYAGVASDEAFDVTPYAEALTRYLLRHPLSSSLPRKFKIAFEGCDEDHALTAINDIGWRARVRDAGALRGFRVTVGGGTSSLCRSGHLLYEFLPAGEMLDVAEAVIRVFRRLGDYQHKHRNRMKYLIKALGWKRWHAEFLQALAEFRAEGGARLPFDPQNPPVEGAPDRRREAGPPPLEVSTHIDGSKVDGRRMLSDAHPALPVMSGDFADWLRTNVRPQKQFGYSIVMVTLPLGDLTTQQMRTIGRLAVAYGDGAVRVTPEQDLLFRWVSSRDVADLHRLLAAAGLGLAGATTIAGVTSCPGAESCRLAVTQSRGLGRWLGDHLRSRPDLVAAAPDLKIKISGCPSGCGHHHIAGLGFQGSFRKVGGKALPQYLVTVGGGVDETGARFGRLAARIPARRCGEALERLLALYRADRTEGERAGRFFQRVALARVKAVLSDLERIAPQDVVAEDFVDLSEQSEFRPEIQNGECSA